MIYNGSKKILFIYRECINRPYYSISGSAKYGCNFFISAQYVSVNGLTYVGTFFLYDTFKIVQKYFTDAFNGDLIYSSDMQMWESSLDLFDWCFRVERVTHDRSCRLAVSLYCLLFDVGYLILCPTRMLVTRLSLESTTDFLNYAT